MSDFAVNLLADKNGVRIPLRVTPRGHTNAVTGTRNGILILAVTAPPADGAANAAVIQVLSDVLHCPKRALTLRHGKKSRDKVVAVAGLEIDDVRARLEKHL